jgi:protein-arginine kinase activator protein McsA
MSTAFVFLNCELGTEHAIIDEMKGISGVSEAVRVSGVYDIVAKVSDESREHISKVVKKIRGIVNIRSSLTMVVAEDVVKYVEVV